MWTRSFGRALAVAVLAAAAVEYVKADPLSASIMVDRSATMTTDRLVVIVTGSYSCGPLPQPQPMFGTTFADAGGSVQQASGRTITNGEFGFIPLCDGAQHTYRAQAFASNMPWHGGLARASVNLHVVLCCDESGNQEFADASVNAGITIQGGGEASP